MLTRSEAAKLVMRLERVDDQVSKPYARALSEIVIARAERKGLGPAVDDVLRRLLERLDPPAPPAAAETP